VTGAVAWITGLPSAGKSTFARHLRERLAAIGRAAVILDGDAVRAALVPEPGYDPAGRAAFYETLGNLALALAEQGLVAIVAATGHRRAFRDRVRARSPRFVEVYLQASADDCADRDPKGLWARARAGTAPALPGAGLPYEPPVAPEIVASGGEDPEAVDAAAALLARAARPIP
jgi:adenylylsulfate kinase